MADHHLRSQRLSAFPRLLSQLLGVGGICALILVLGCQPSSPEESALDVQLSLTPSPPAVGESEVALMVKDAEGKPLEGAQVRVEGNMNHAGMKPSFADLEEGKPGHYTGTLDFTMGGDWFLLVTVTTRDGQILEKKIDVPGVKSK